MLQERQIIQNTRNSILGKKAEGLPALRFAGVILQGGVIGYDTNQTTGGLGANYLGIGGTTNYREDVVTVALRAVSVSTGRVVASVTTTKTIYSVLLDGSIFKFVAVDKLLQVEGGFSRNSPITLGVREAVQLAVYSLIFEGVKNHLWHFQDPVAGAAFMAQLDAQQRAVDVQPIPAVARQPLPAHQHPRNRLPQRRIPSQQHPRLRPRRHPWRRLPRHGRVPKSGSVRAKRIPGRRPGVCF